MLTSQVAFAQTGARTNSAPAGDTKSEDASALPSVVVTANRREETLQHVPVAVSAIDGRNLTAEGQRFIGDATTFVPNAKAQNPDGDGRPRWYVRGLGTGDVGAATVYPVGLYVDDVYLNPPVAGGGALFDLERIEILRGPQGTLYGKNTTAGAINVISRKPSFTNGGYVSAGIGNYNSKLLEGAVTGTIIPDRVAARASFYYEGRDGFANDTGTGRSLGDLDKRAVRAQFLVRVTEDLDALLKVHSSTFNGTGNNGSLPLGTYFGSYRRPAGRDTQTNVENTAKLDQDGVSLTLNYSLGRHTLTSITAIDNTKNFAIGDNDYTPFEQGRSYGNARYKQRSQEFRITSPREDRLNWIAGFHYFDEDLKNESVVAALPATLPNGAFNQSAANPAYRRIAFDHDTKSYAIFGSTTYNFTDKFNVTAGLRWTREEKDIDLSLLQYQTAGTNQGPFWLPSSLVAPVALAGAGTNGSGARSASWNAYTWDLTPEYKLSDTARVFFRYARGFRSGGFNTGLSNSLGQLTTVRPEYLTSYELGTKTEWLNGRVIANASVFYYDYKDIQVNLLTFNGGFLTTALTNGARGKVKGAEFELSAQPTSRLLTKFSLALLDSEYTDFVNRNPLTGVVTGNYSGNRFVRSPRVTAALGSYYTIPLNVGGKIIAGGDISYRGKEFFLADRQTSADLPLSQSGFSLLNLRATYVAPQDKLSVVAYVNNVTDKLYQVHGRPNGAVGSGNYVITYGNPRTFGVTVTSKF